MSARKGARRDNDAQGSMEAFALLREELTSVRRLNASLLAALQRVIESATPHPVDHPAMSAAWKVVKPLVVDVGSDTIVWVQDGRGWKSKPGEAWRPLEADAPGIGGIVLTAAQVLALVGERGRPVTT